MTIRFDLQKALRFAAIGAFVFAACSKSQEEKGKQIVAAPTLAEAELLDEAMKAEDSGLYSVAKQSWTNLRDGYPGSYFVPLAELKAADSFYQLSDYAAAQAGYEEFLRVHPGHEAIPYVRYQLGNCFLGQYMGEKHDQSPLTQAIKLYEQVVADYPSSEYAVLARRQILEAREFLARHEAYVAGFYLKQGYANASAKRIAKLEQEFPESSVATNTRSTLRDEYPEQGSTLGERTEDEVATTRHEPTMPRPVVRQKEEPPIQPLVVTAAATTGKPAAEQLEEVDLFGVTCEENNGIPIFVVHLARALPYRTDIAQRDNTLQLVFSENAPAQGGTTTKNGSSGAKLCELAQASVSVTDLGDKKRGVQLVIKYQQENEPVVMNLDRPDRIVVVLKPALSKNS